MNIQARTKASQPHGMKDGHRTEDSRLRTEDRGQKTEGKRKKADQ